MMAPLLTPIPPMPAVLPRIVDEFPDGSVVRFSKARGRYNYAAVRRGQRWETTATADWGSINEVMSWKESAVRVRRFEVVSRWFSVEQRGNPQTREQFAVIRFTIDGQYLVAINVADDGGFEGLWYTSITEAAERSLPFGDQADWSEITRNGQYIQSAAAWQPL